MVKLMDETITPLPLSLAVVVFALCQKQLSVLLKRRKHFPFEKEWELIQAQINAERDGHLEESVRYHLKDLLSLEVPFLEQVQTIGSALRDPRGWSVCVVYYSLVCYEKVVQSKEWEQQELQWVPIEYALKASLAFDHSQVLESCLHRFQNKSLYTSLPFFLLAEEFTLTEAQQAYEAILGFKIEKKSFRRRLLEAQLVEETENTRRASHRPAQLYRLVHSQPYFFARTLEGMRAPKSKLL